MINLQLKDMNVVLLYALLIDAVAFFPSYCSLDPTEAVLKNKSRNRRQLHVRVFDIIGKMNEIININVQGIFTIEGWKQINKFS